MPARVEIRLLGEMRVFVDGAPSPLPASRKARALLAYLALTARPHRRERLCELFWDLPDDPKAALRWSLSKLRKVMDGPDEKLIQADRERVSMKDPEQLVDISRIHARLRSSKVALTMEELETMATDLDTHLMDGLDGAGDETFDTWLRSERENAQIARIEVLRRLAQDRDLPPARVQKWRRLWQEADPKAVSLKRDAPAAGRRTRPSATATLRAPTVRALREQRIGFCTARDGTKIAHATVGTGPPILKAANWLNHVEFDWASPIWGQSFADTARWRTFIRYDERGCGLSDWDVADLSFDAFVEDLEVVADSLGLDRFPLIGISQGAPVSVEYAVRHPERVSALILISGYSAGWRISVDAEERARREAVLNLTELGWGTDNPAYRHIFSQTFMPNASAEDLAWFDEFQRRTTSARNAARFQLAFGDIDVRHRLNDVRVPTIVLHARQDQRIPLSEGRSLAAGIPGARFVPLESRNHILVDGEPARRACFVAVARFLAEIGA